MIDSELLAQCEKVLRLYAELLAEAKVLDDETFAKNPTAIPNGSTISLIALDLARTGSFEEFLRLRTSQANAFAAARAKLTPEECRLLGVVEYVASFSRENNGAPPPLPRSVLKKFIDKISSDV